MVPSLGLALLAALALSGLAAASASATTQRWHSCNNVGGEAGAFTDSACQSAGKGSFSWSELGSSPTAFTLQGSTPYTITATIGGMNAVVNCSNAQASGSLANPSGETAATLSTPAGTSLSLSGCSITNKATGKACPIENGLIQFNALSGEATELGGSPALKLQPVEGTTLATSKAQPGECGFKFTITLALQGSLTAVVNPATSSLEVTEAGSKTTFKVNGGSAIFNGTAKVETAAKQGLKLGAITPPVNTALPSISPTSPNVGEIVSAANGTWTQYPSSYTYQWKRCDAAGAECQNITAATKSTYTVAALDEARALVVEVTAKNGGGSSTAAASKPTGIVNAQVSGTHYWYACKEVGPGGIYASSSCTGAPGVGNYEWVKLAEGAPLNFTSANLGPVRLYYTISKMNYAIECSSEAGSGSVVNPVGGGAGTLTGSNQLLALSGCKYTTPAYCSISEGKITSSSVNGTTVAGNIAFSAGGSKLFSSLNPGCTPAAMEITGTLNGKVNSVNSSLDFNTATSGSELKNSGAPTSVEGSIRLNTEFGLLRFKP